MTMQIDGEILGYCTPGNSNIDPELWFSDLKHEYDYAKALCRTRCAVRATCFEGAIERREQFGVWADDSLAVTGRMSKVYGDDPGAHLVLATDNEVTIPSVVSR